MCIVWSMLDHSQDRQVSNSLGGIMWKDEKNYHFCDWIIDKWLDKMEAKMNFDCPDSYQVRGMKEE